jgi:hypothetical protein
MHTAALRKMYDGTTAPLPRPLQMLHGKQAAAGAISGGGEQQASSIPDKRRLHDTQGTLGHG